MKDLITIIINVYNGEKFINTCLDSIINQTYENIEILIVNDGSTDNTLKICKSYKDKRIKIITTENQGLSLSRNVGIDNAKGKYIFFIDADDYILKDTIEYLYNLCINNKVYMSTCKNKKVHSFDNIQIDNNEKVDIISSNEMLKKILLNDNTSVAIWNKLIHKKIFNNIRFEKRIANDVVITYKIALETDKIAFGYQEKYCYLQHIGSITYKNEGKRAIDLYKATLERYNNLKTMYPYLIENRISMIDRIMYTFFNEKEMVQEFLKKENAIKLSRKLFSFKFLFINISLARKMKLLLFFISPRFYRFLRKKYVYKIGDKNG